MQVLILERIEQRLIERGAQTRLRALVEAPAGVRNYPPGGYMKNKDGLSDPWENAFQYQSPGQHNPHTFDVWSQGADGAPGGTGLGAEIGNWSSDDDE